MSDNTNLWRAAVIETRSPGFGPDEWTRRTDLPAITIHPGEHVRHVARVVASQINRKPSDVRLVVLGF